MCFLAGLDRKQTVDACGNAARYEQGGRGIAANDMRMNARGAYYRHVSGIAAQARRTRVKKIPAAMPWTDRDNKR